MRQDFSDFDHVMVVGARQAGVSKSAHLLGFLAHKSLYLTQNGKKNIKCLVSRVRQKHCFCNAKEVFNFGETRHELGERNP